MDLSGSRKTTLKEVIAIWGIYCVIASSASQVGFHANNHLEESIKRDFFNKKHINVVDFSKDPSLAQDFPKVDVLSHILPLVTFICKDKQPGYYADHTFRCEIFHFCNQDGTRSTYTCPFRTRFNQENGACEDEQTVQCDPDVIQRAVDARTRDVIGSGTKNITLTPKKRVARQAIFHQSLPQNTRIIPGSNVLFVPQNPDTGFVRFLVPQQQQQPLLQLNLAGNSPFVPPQNRPTAPAVQVQRPPANLVPSNGIFVQSPSAHRAPTIIHAGHLQHSLNRQGQLAPQQRPATSGSSFSNQHRLPSSGLSLIRQDVPVQLPQAATFQTQQRPPPTRLQQPVASFGTQQQQRPPTGPQPQVTSFGNQQRPSSTPFAGQARQAPQGFDQRRPPNPFDPDFFDEGFPGPFFQGGPPRFANQNNRPQTPDSFFFGQPPFQQNPGLDEGFFDSNFPQLNLGPPQRPQPHQSPNEAQPPQQQVGTNFNLSPEDNAFINEIRFPGPPQGHRVVTPEPPREPTTGRPAEGDHRRPTAPQRPPPHRPPQQGFEQQDSGERGNARFPSRFPPETPGDFGFQPQHDQRRPPQNEQRPPPQRPQRPPPPQRDQRPPQRDQRPPQHDRRLPAQFPSGPFFEQPDVPQQPSRPVQEIPSPPRRPIPTTVPAQNAPTRPAPSRVPHHRRPQVDESSGHVRRPLATSTPSSAQAPPTRGRHRFRPSQGNDFDLQDQEQDTPQRGPEAEDQGPHRPVSTEAFGIPDPTEDFGSRDPQFQAPPTRRPTSNQRRPPASPELFSANPSRPVELSTPASVPLRRPSTAPNQQSSSGQRFRPNDQSDSSSEGIPRGQRGQQGQRDQVQRPSSGQRFRPNDQSDFSNEGIPRGQQGQRDQVQHSPFQQSTAGQRFPTRGPSESSTEREEGIHPGHRGQGHRFEKPSTDHPNDFFSSQEPTFPTTTHGTSSSEEPNQGNVRPGQGQGFPQFFAPNENNFGELGIGDENFRRPFFPTSNSDRGHRGPPDSVSSTQPSFQDAFNPFLEEDKRPNRLPDSGPTFSDANFPSAPTFGPQSVDQLAPPELPPFTPRPDTPDRVQEQEDESEDAPRGHVQRGRPITTSNPRQFSADATPSDISPATKPSTAATAKRGRRPTGVTSEGGKAVRTRPTRKRGRGRRPTTTEAISDIANDVTTTVKPRRRVRPAGGARKRPIAQRTRAQTTTTTAIPTILPEDSTPAPARKRKPIALRVQTGQGAGSRAVVRRRRPVSTSTASSDPSDTVDHSATKSREHLSSDSTNRKVTIVSKLDAVQDSAISASHERVTVTKADFEVSPETSSIKDHSSTTTSTEAMDDGGSTSVRPASPTTEITTTTTTQRPEVRATNEIPTPSTVTVTKVTTTSSTSSSVDSKPEALTKLKLLLNRKFILKLTTEAPSS